MSNEPSGPEPDRRWLWATVVLTALSAAVVIVYAVYVYVLEGSPRNVSLSVLLGFFALPYIAALRLLMRKNVKRGLAMATGTGMVAFLLLLYAAFTIVTMVVPTEEVLTGLTVISFPAFMQLLLVFSAWRAFHTMERKPDDGRVLVRGVFRAVVVFGAVIIISVLEVSSYRGTRFTGMGVNEASAANSIRQIGSCAMTYQIGHPDIGFPNDVAHMGPGRGIDYCLDQVLTAATGVSAEADRTPKSGYVFTYRPTKPVDGVNTGHVITGVPARCGRTGVKTYWSDETGVIHFESDNWADCPPATATSPMMS